MLYADPEGRQIHVKGCPLIQGKDQVIELTSQTAMESMEDLGFLRHKCVGKRCQFD